MDNILSIIEQEISGWITFYSEEVKYIDPVKEKKRYYKYKDIIKHSESLQEELLSFRVLMDYKDKITSILALFGVDTGYFDRVDGRYLDWILENRKNYKTMTLKNINDTVFILQFFESKNGRLPENREEFVVFNTKINLMNK